MTRIDEDYRDQPVSVITGSKDRPWHMRAWSGINVSGWSRVVWKNRFAISPQRIPMAMIITGLSGMNSVLGLLQQLFFRRRIAETEVFEAPIFVVGHWRSGTTLLHELLVCDPHHTCPDTYACFAPNHFLLTERYLRRLIGFLLPPTRPMDNMAIRWDRPQEDEWALCNMGLPSPYFTMLFPNRPPQDSEYSSLRAISEADRQRWKRKFHWFLKCLTLRTPKRIVLKTPLHTSRVRTLLEMFPQARFIHIVRSPFDVFPSTIHTWRRLYRYQGLQVPRWKGLEEYVLDTFCKMYEAFNEDRNLVPDGQFCEVRYEDLVADPVGQTERIYAEIGLTEFSEARVAIESYAERMSGFQTNRFEVAPDMRERIVTRWADYIHEYGYSDL